VGGPATPAPDGPRPRWSKDADKYLLPHEQPPVIATRRHWAVLVVPMAKALPVLAIGFWLMVLDPQNRLTASVGLIVLVGALGYLAQRVGVWWRRYFFITNRRVLLTTGLIVRTVALLPLRRITDLTYKETLFGQLLGYGTFRFESAGQDQALRRLTFMPDAPGLYHRVSELLFGSDYGAATRGDDEGNPDPPPPPAADAQRQDTRPLPPLPPLPPRRA
jgi:membrane protein YdbS with pleckstrin-like domain